MRFRDYPAKDSLMFVVIIGSWILSLLYFNPRLFSLLIGPENLFAKFGILVFIMLLNLFWFYGIFYTVIFLFSYFSKKSVQSLRFSNLPSSLKGCPRAAILYPTMNDFRPDAVRSCLEQDYENFHLFILDDSTEDKIKAEINEFGSKFPDKVTIIRREERDGYKAGNVNNALRQIEKDYPCFAISDADGILPGDFITKLLPYFSLSPHIAFVQAAQRANPAQKSEFGRELGLNINIHWRRFMSVRNRCGFVMFYGHGALMRTDVWRETGGFPEVATEDLAYSLKIRARGYQGIIANEVKCYEDFPPDYQRFRKRNEKWIRGTAECLKKFFPEFRRSKKVPWFEKLDVFISAFSLFLPFPFLLFLILVALILPLYFVNFEIRGPLFLIPVAAGKHLPEILFGFRYNVFWSWDFYLMMCTAIFYSFIPVAVDLFKRPGRAFSYLAVSTFSSLSIVVVSSLNFFSYLVTRKAVFPVTGDTKGFSGNSNYKAVFLLEFIFGGVFVYLALSTKNLWFLSVAFALLLSPLVNILGWEKKWLRPFIYAPMVLTLFIIILIGLSVWRV
ncbi:MAG: glycosyltransferase [Candidatus Ratteibacteria bacterium]|nr:glycosyltransferase [Candidatus Ratteibacteria bacterium]